MSVTLTGCKCSDCCLRCCWCSGTSMELLNKWKTRSRKFPSVSKSISQTASLQLPYFWISLHVYCLIDMFINFTYCIQKLWLKNLLEGSQFGGRNFTTYNNISNSIKSDCCYNHFIVVISCLTILAPLKFLEQLASPLDVWKNVG